MVIAELHQALSDCAAEVLESMFFNTVVANAAPSQDITGASLAAGLVFHGNPSGRFGVRVPVTTGQKIAATFLGMEEESVSVPRIAEVVCELANMLCGSVLSRLQKDSRFTLSHPELDLLPGGGGLTVSRALELEDGTLAVWLELEQVP